MEKTRFQKYMDQVKKDTEGMKLGNVLLDLIGSDCSLSITYDRLFDSGVYLVAVSDSKHKVVETFTCLDAQMAEHDIVLYCIEKCVRTLKDLKEQ